MMEKLTQDMADAAWKIIEEVQAMGGMVKAVDSGWAKLKIEAAAADKQARIDSGQDVIVGVNKYRLDSHDAVEARDIDNVAVREGQIRRLKTIRAGRDAKAVDAALAALSAAGSEGSGNLLDLSIKAMRVRATVGEVSDALEKAFGRHRADTHKVSGVYAASYDTGSESGDAMKQWDAIKADIALFAEQQGRRRCSRPRWNVRARRSRTTCMRSACRHWPQATRRWFRPSLPSCASRAVARSSSLSAASCPGRTTIF